MIRCFALALIAAAALPVLAVAQAPEPMPELDFAADDHSRARDGVDAGELMALADILDLLRERFDGHHIGVDGPVEIGAGRYGYTIKWLTEEGSVLYIYVDAETGGVLSVQGN
jgi:uncharacterized membrane protein YkoI